MPASTKRSRSPSRSGEDEPFSKRARDEVPVLDPSTNDVAYVVEPSFSKIKGDIFLRVGNTLFPVQINKLKEVRGLFADLFSIPQPEDQERIYGLPYCDMFNCTVRELRALLKHIYGVKNHFRKNLEDDRVAFNLENILDVLKLSCRFDLQVCRQQAIDALDEFFNLMWRHVMYTAPVPSEPAVAIFGSSMLKPHAMSILSFRMINVFQECEMVYFLPMAYYFAAQESVEGILSGVQLPDGSREIIPHSDQLIVLQGRDDLRKVRRHSTFSWLFTHAGNTDSYLQSHGCDGKPPTLSGKTCYDFIMELYMFITSDSDFLSNRRDALDSISAPALEVMNSHLCSACQDYFDFRIRKDLAHSWSLLPQIFGETTWEALRKAQIRVDGAWLGRY